MKRSKMFDEFATPHSALQRRWMMWLCAACMMLLTACKTEDDKVIIQQQHSWIDKKVAVVYPNRNAMTKAQLERTAKWFLDNFQEAQLSNDVCVRLQLDWYDELTSDLNALSTKLANDTNVVAIVGPFNSSSLEVFAQACQRTEKPLIAPTATSEEIIRRYAVPSQSGLRTVRPFLWSLTETDVAFAEVVMTAYATLAQKLSFTTPNAILFSPANVYGKTFADWAPFQAENLDVDLTVNPQYTSTDDLLKQIKGSLYSGSAQEGILNAFYSNFCVIESVDQLCQVTGWRRKCFIDYLDINDTYDLPATTPYDDPVYDKMAAQIEQIYRIYFALNDFSQEEIDALTARQRAILQYYQGFSPYADPTTGFEISYEQKFGVKPTFEECKFYDGLMLAAFACYKQTVSSQTTTDADAENAKNIAFNQTIYNLTFPNADANLSASVWSASAMELYLRSLKSGQVPKFRGASGNIAFDAETCTAAAGTTYVHWQIVDGKIHNNRYFSSDGSHRAGEATVAWNYYYDENTAKQRFAEQALDQDAGITYPALTGQYAVLVHGSSEFSDCRHLADVLNVYQLLKRGGFDDDHIILIADRSVADDASNPEPGVIRSSIDGPNLVQGASIDYDAAQLTTADIVDILSGRQSSRLSVVVPPDKGHNIFLYWSGHGRTSNYGGADEFVWRDTPAGMGLTAQLLRQTVSQMHQAQAYRKLFILAEPCYAEAVVKNIEGIDGVLAMTGANAQEQSWADNWNKAGSFWMCDRFTSNVVQAITAEPGITYRDLFLYCAQHTLGSHARIINASRFGNLYHSGPAEFVSTANTHY